MYAKRTSQMFSNYIASGKHAWKCSKTGDSSVILISKSDANLFLLDWSPHGTIAFGNRGYNLPPGELEYKPAQFVQRVRLDSARATCMRSERFCPLTNTTLILMCIISFPARNADTFEHTCTRRHDKMLLLLLFFFDCCLVFADRYTVTCLIGLTKTLLRSFSRTRIPNCLHIRLVHLSPYSLVKIHQWFVQQWPSEYVIYIVAFAFWSIRPSWSCLKIFMSHFNSIYEGWSQDRDGKREIQEIVRLFREPSK